MLRELDQRNASGDIVTLRWCDETDRVSLTVHRWLDDLGCELVTAEIEDVPPELARDAFEHPYAYAWHSGSVTLPSRVSLYATTEDDDDAEDSGATVEHFTNFPPIPPAGGYFEED